MERLKQKLEALDEAIFVLEDQVGLSHTAQQELVKKQSSILKESRTREASAMAAAQKIAARLDQAIDRVERVLR